MTTKLQGFVRRFRGRPAVTLMGEADRTNVASVRRLLYQARYMGRRIILDLKGLRFVDGGFARLLLEFLSSLPASGRLTIVHPSEGIRRVLELSGVTRDRRVRME